MAENYGERIAKVEEKVDTIEKRVDDLSDIKGVVAELALLSRQQVEQNKEFKEVQEMLVVSNTEFSATLKTINNNLSNINAEAEKTNTRLNDLEVKFDCIDDKSKVDILTIIRSVIPWLLGAGIMYGIMQVAKMI